MILPPKTTLLVVLVLAISGCRTYEIPARLHSGTFTAMDTSTMGWADATGPFAEAHAYRVNAISEVALPDRKGREGRLVVTPATEMRITTKAGERHPGFFDASYVKDGILVMPRGRLFGDHFVRIPVEDIARMELQDGGKRYTYQEPVRRPLEVVLQERSAP